MRINRLILPVLTILLAQPVIAQPSEVLGRIQELRLRGELEQAQALAEEEIRASTDHTSEILLRLELSRILDRFGLHLNTRPVVEARAQIDTASRGTRDGDRANRAAVELELANYEYRAEMQERKFTRAMGHVESAIELYQQLDDSRGEADAVHKLGLIRLQQGELEEARQLFDRSLELDRVDGERLFFVGEYERHVGFVYLMREDPAGALPHLRKSLDARKRSGAIDASLFAANTLAATLTRLGRPEEAEPIALYGFLVADRIDSPVGKARLSLTLGRNYLVRGDRVAAVVAFQNALKSAESVNYESVAIPARTSLEELTQD